jgi:hypothetical protein
VATDTLTSGTAGVGVKTGDGVRVTVGVNMGVKVGIVVAVSTMSMGITAIAVCVAAETIVAMTAVPRELISSVGAGTLVTAHARETITKTVTDKRMGVGFLITPPFGPQRKHNPKQADPSACLKDVCPLRFVPMSRDGSHRRMKLSTRRRRLEAVFPRAGCPSGFLEGREYGMVLFHRLDHRWIF